MGRAPRKVSESGYYHVVMSGNGGWVIFEDDLDRQTFQGMLAKKLKSWPIAVIAWCLMSTHVHLVLREDEPVLSKFVQSLETCFSLWFNGRWGREGHLFQSRFWSRPIESDGELLEVVRYVHNNPVKAGICSRQDYPWSSDSEYRGHGGLCDTEMVLSLLGSRRGYEEFFNSTPAHPYIPRLCRRMTDERALEFAKGELQGMDPRSLGSLERADRIAAIQKLGALGMSASQIGRITGLGRRIISNALQCAKSV